MGGHTHSHIHTNTHTLIHTLQLQCWRGVGMRGWRWGWNRPGGLLGFVVQEPHASGLLNNSDYLTHTERHATHNEGPLLRDKIIFVTRTEY